MPSEGGGLPVEGSISEGPYEKMGLNLSDWGENYRTFFLSTLGSQCCSLGPFPPTSTPHPSRSLPSLLLPSPLAHKPLLRLQLVRGKCVNLERGWKHCTEVKGSVGGSGRKSETPVYPELSLMPQSQQAQGLPLHASHPPYFLSFKFPSARTPSPQD